MRWGICVVLVVACGKSGAPTIEQVDRQPVCEALAWDDSLDHVRTLEWERSAMGDPAKAKKYGIDDPTAALAAIDADIARLKREDSRACLELPQRLFDCAPWSDVVPDDLAAVVQQRADWKKGPKDCASAAGTLVRRFQEPRLGGDKPSASHSPVWTRLADQRVTGIDLDGDRAYVADREAVSAWVADKQVWHRALEGTFALLAATDGTLVAAGPRAVTGLDRASGEVRWTVPAPGEAPAIAAAAGANGIELLTGDGTLVTIAVGAACKGAPACALNPVKVGDVGKSAEVIAGDGVTLVNTGSTLRAYGPDHALRFELHGYHPFALPTLVDASHLVAFTGDTLLRLDLAACAAPSPVVLEPSPLQLLATNAQPERLRWPTTDCPECAPASDGCIAARRRYPGFTPDGHVGMLVDGKALAVHINRELELLDATDLSLRWSANSSYGGAPPVPDGRGGWLVVGFGGQVDGYDAAGTWTWFNPTADEHHQVWAFEQARGPDGRVLLAIHGAYNNPDGPAELDDTWRYRIGLFDFGTKAP